MYLEHSDRTGQRKLEWVINNMVPITIVWQQSWETFQTLVHYPTISPC